MVQGTYKTIKYQKCKDSVFYFSISTFQSPELIVIFAEVLQIVVKNLNMEWISTKNKNNLPADFQDVLLYQENNGIFIGWLENGIWIVDNTFVETDDYKSIIRGNVKQEEVTFWRQLPPNPQWDFFKSELKTCYEWYEECKSNVRIVDFKIDTSTNEFTRFWKTEKVSKEDFIKRIVNFDVERL